MLRVLAGSVDHSHWRVKDLSVVSVDWLIRFRGLFWQ